MIRYEIRSERKRTTLVVFACDTLTAVYLEGRYRALSERIAPSEIWRVNLEERDGGIVETGSWPVIPGSRADAKFCN